MQSIKCPECGLVMLAGAPTCKSCGAPLLERRAQPPTSAYQVGSFDRDERQQTPSGSLARISFLTLLLGWLLLAASKYIGVLAWPIALVSFLAAMVTGVITIVMRLRSRAPNARLWRPATTTVISSALLLKCIVFLVALTITSALGGKPPEWREYVSQDGGFTVQMPSEPEVRIDQIDSKVGPVFMHSLYAKLEGNGSCTSIYFDYSEYELTMPVAAFLDHAVKMFLEKFDSTLISKKEISLDGYEGVEVESTPNGTSTRRPIRSTTRLYWVPDKKYVYVNHVVGIESGTLYTQRSRFLESFRFTAQLEREEAQKQALRNPPLLDAVVKGDMARVKSLLPEATDFDKQLAMVVAVTTDRSDAVEALIAAKASLAGPDDHGRTALMAAAVHCPRCVPLLVRAGADLNAQDVTNGWTALVWSLEEGQAVSAKQLIAAGTNLDLRDQKGRTALMHTAALGSQTVYKEVVQWLLAKGADTSIQDNEGKTAVAIAERSWESNPTSKIQAETLALLKRKQ